MMNIISDTAVYLTASILERSIDIRVPMRIAQKIV